MSRDWIAEATPRPWRAMYDEMTLETWLEAPTGDRLGIDMNDSDAFLIEAAVNEYEDLLAIEAEVRRLFAQDRMAGLVREFLARLDATRSTTA